MFRKLKTEASHHFALSAADYCHSTPFSSLGDESFQHIYCFLLLPFLHTLELSCANRLKMAEYVSETT